MKIFFCMYKSNPIQFIYLIFYENNDIFSKSVIISDIYKNNS